MAQQRPYLITLDERRLATQRGRFSVPPGRAAMGHEDAFPRPRLSARCRFSEGTFAERRGNGRDAPIAAGQDHDGAAGIDPEAARRLSYSITSSARARIDDGTVSPSALAVLRLTTSSKVVGCWTGRSAGLAPLRILPA
jgi:hypothetical protein